MALFSCRSLLGCVKALGSLLLAGPLLWRNWAELAWGLFGDGFWVVADFSRIKCAFRVAFCRLMQDTCGLIWLNCL